MCYGTKLVTFLYNNYGQKLIYSSEIIDNYCKKEYFIKYLQNKSYYVYIPLKLYDKRYKKTKITAQQIIVCFWKKRVLRENINKYRKQFKILM